MANDATCKSVDIPIEAAYDSFGELPEWAQKKLLCLKLWTTRMVVESLLREWEDAPRVIAIG